MEFQIFFNIKTALPEKLFQEVFASAKKELGSIEEHKKDIENKDLTINVVLIDNQEIQKLNKEWRGKDAPTDVLSFPYSPIEGGVFGEIFLSLERCQEQAEHMGHSLEKECAVLLIHGILHLFGYDHVEDEDYKLMHELEEKILKTVPLQ